MRKQSLLFATFLLCCLSLTLLVASLSTNSWVNAAATRKLNFVQEEVITTRVDRQNTTSGFVTIGLFNGRRELNVGYGWRILPVFTEPLKGASHFSLAAWITTVSTICGTILFAVIGALMALVNVATKPTEIFTGITGLFVWNSACVVLCLIGVISFMCDYLTRLSSNILTQEDIENHWTTENMAYLGYSFWFVVGSGLIHLANIILLTLVNSNERQQNVLPTGKSTGAVLLY